MNNKLIIVKISILVIIIGVLIYHIPKVSGFTPIELSWGRINSG